MQENTEITLRNSSGHIVGSIHIEYLIQNQGHFEVKWNKRGNIKYAIRKERNSLQPLSNDGESFLQSLKCGGAVWALIGTPGAARA